MDSPMPTARNACLGLLREAFSYVYFYSIGPLSAGVNILMIKMSMRELYKKEVD
jgi:hypothetical protein